MDIPINFDENKDEYLKIKHGKAVGNGTHGFVLEGFWNEKKVAIKNLFNFNEKQVFLKEIENLCQINHENIIKCLGYSKENAIIVMEFSENGSLHELLYSFKRLEYNLAHALSWALQCARGINYLHTFGSKPILHRDLKTLNLLLLNNYKTLKICDFGTSCNIKTNMTAGQGTVCWMAPEVFRSNKYNEKCDVFSWAIILWQVLSRQLTYPKEISTLAIMLLVNNGTRPPFLSNCPKVIENLLKMCWSDNPNDRPSMKIICDKMSTIFSIVKKWVDVDLTVATPKTNYENCINEQTVRASDQMNEVNVNQKTNDFSICYNLNGISTSLSEPTNLHVLSGNQNSINNCNFNNIIKCYTSPNLDCINNYDVHQNENENQDNYSEVQIQISQPAIEIVKIHDLKISEVEKSSDKFQPVSISNKNSIKSIPIFITSRGRNSFLSRENSFDENDIKGCMNFVSTFSKVLYASKTNNFKSESKFYLNNTFDSIPVLTENTNNQKQINLTEKDKNVISEITYQTFQSDSKTSNLSISSSYDSSTFFQEFFKNTKNTIDKNNLDKHNYCDIEDEFNDEILLNNTEEIENFKSFENGIKKLNESNIKYKIKNLKNILTAKSFI